MEAGKSASKIEKIGSDIKGNIVHTVEKVERKIYNWHHKGKTRTGHTGGAENSAAIDTSQHTVCSPLPNASDEGSLVLRDNSNVQINIVQSSGQPTEAPASGGSESRGANSGGKFVLQGNKDLQLCLTSVGVGAPSSSSSGGDTIITGNTKTQLYSASGVTAEGANGESSASTDITKNPDCQIMNIQQPGSSAAVKISENSGSHIMNVQQSENGASKGFNESADRHIVNEPTGTTLDETRHFPLPRSFQNTSATIAPNYDFLDVALTKENTVLVAISEHGLIEYILNGEERSRWRPNKQRTSEPEEVVAVATLSDGRTAAGLCNSQVVVVLRRTGRRNAAGHGWTEDLRLPKLQSTPWRISVHADLLAVALGRFDKVGSCWRQGRHVQLLRLSDKAQANRLSPLYDVHSLTITDDLIITVSYGKVSTSSSRGVHVVDAHNLADSIELLWRYDAVTDDEEIQGVCAASEAGLLYALVLSSNLSCGRIVIISLYEGIELLSHALGFCNPLLPVCLSLCDDVTKLSGSITTVLCRDLKSAEWRIVTVQNNSARCLKCLQP